MFEVEGKHLKEFDKELYLQLVYFPAEMISCFDQVIRDLYERYFIEPETNEKTKQEKTVKNASILMGIKGMHEEERISVKDLGPMNIGRLVVMRAIVVRVSEIFP